MGVEPFLIASSLLGIVAQRLVRTICLSCKEEYIAKREEIEELRLSTILEDPLKLYRGRGCVLCNYTGFSGRTGVFEILRVTRDIRELITRRASLDEIREKAEEEGMKTLFYNAREKILSGITTFEEAKRVIHWEGD
jgi:type IV pilus assembly protein PilB